MVSDKEIATKIKEKIINRLESIQDYNNLKLIDKLVDILPFGDIIILKRDFKNDKYEYGYTLDFNKKDINYYYALLHEVLIRSGLK